MQDTTTGNNTTQELVILVFDIHNKKIVSGTGNDRITSNVYEIRTFPDKAAILKSILVKHHIQTTIQRSSLFPTESKESLINISTK